MATAATPPIGVSPGSAYPGPPPTGSAPPPPTSGTPSSPSLRLRFAHWMENTFGRAYLPIAMAGGGVVGGTLGMLTLGPVGGLAGAALGALLGGALVFSD